MAQFNQEEWEEEWLGSRPSTGAYRRVVCWQLRVGCEALFTSSLRSCREVMDGIRELFPEIDTRHWYVAPIFESDILPGSE